MSKSKLREKGLDYYELQLKPSLLHKGVLYVRSELRHENDGNQQSEGQELLLQRFVGIDT